MTKQAKFILLFSLFTLTFSLNSLFAANPFLPNQKVITNTCSDSSCDSDNSVVIINGLDQTSSFSRNSCSKQSIVAGKNGCYGPEYDVKIKGIDEAADGLAKGIKKFSDSLSKILEGVSALGKAINGDKKGSGSKGLKENVKELGNSIGGLFKNIWKWVKSLWKGVFTTNSDKKKQAKADRKEAAKKIKESLGAIKNPGKETVSIVKDAIKGKSKTLGEKIEEKYQKIKDKIKGEKTPGEKLADSVQDLLDTIKGKSKPKTWSEKLKAKYQKVKDMITGKKTSSEKLGEAVDDLIATLKGKPKPKTTN